MAYYFLFPYEQVRKDSRVVLYGAGECGQQYYKQITLSGYCDIFLWCDKSAKAAALYYQLPVSEPQAIRNAGLFDYVIVAISNPQTALGVAKWLMESFDIPKDKIITKVYDLRTQKPVNRKWEQFSLAGNDCDRDIEEYAPAELLTHKGLDIVVRYLLCRDLINGIENNDHISLYSRMMLARIHGVREASDPWSDNPVNGIDEILEETKRLCFSLRDSGFDCEKAIPVSSKNNMLIDGGHRMAASIALEKKIWVKYFANVRGCDSFGMDWFRENGFNNNDMLRILRAFADLHSPCSIAVLYGPVIQHWDFIQKQFAKDFTVVGHVDLDFSNNFYAFDQLVNEIYNGIDGQNIMTNAKQDVLKAAPLVLRVILLSDENYRGVDFYGDIRKLKHSIRQSLYPDINTQFLALHTADSAGEQNTAKKLLLSPNNLRCLDNRLFFRYSDVFLERLERAKKLLAAFGEGISLDDVVICGSTVMEIFGLRESRDLDLLVKNSLANKLMKAHPESNIINLDDDIELRFSMSEYFRDTDRLLSDDSLYFIFDEFKVLNLELYKHMSIKDKELTLRSIKCDEVSGENQDRLTRKNQRHDRDIKAIELFEACVRHFDDKAVLKKQIDRVFTKMRFDK